MKKVIEHLQEAKRWILDGNPFTGVTIIDGVIAGLRQAELEAPPRWETPEQYEKRTGEAWPEDWPVWSITTDGILEITTMGEEEVRKTWGNHFYAIPTEAGPPPDGWRPEKTE